MKIKMILAVFLAMVVGPRVALAEQNAPATECGADLLKVEGDQVSIVEEGKETKIDLKKKKAGKAQMAAARTTCRSSGGYTVCSNGRHGCVWSDRSGKLLGCGSGI